MDPIAQQLGIGGCLFLTALWMFLTKKPWKANGDNRQRNDTSTRGGDMSLSYWEDHINSAITRGIRDAFHARDEDLRRIIKDSIRETMQHFYGMRKGSD